ncbi:hypothetical protein NUM3379_06310 [Kineococcus sp. NUM-3379]
MAATPAVAAPPPTTVWLAGDSTMANSSGTNIVGWGREFQSSFVPEATVSNNAQGGRSIQTWMYEGGVSSTMGSNGECTLTSTAPSARWQTTLNGMEQGDFLFIQFGINDGSPTCPRHVGGARYKELMTQMARAATARGARPVLLTPVAAIRCSGSTAVGNRGYLTETREVGAATGAPVIDLHALSVSLYNRLGFCPNDGDYSRGAVGDFFADDHTHFSASGARQIAALVADAVDRQNIPLEAWLRTAQPAPSGVQLVGVASGRCLDVVGSSRTPGAEIDIYDCNGGANQRWVFTSAGELRSFGGELCLDAEASGTAPGTRLVSYTCNGRANQKFARGANGSIVGQQSGLCLDVAARGTANGTRVALWTCSGATNQQWTTR